MKTVACFLVAAFVFAGCNNSQREQQLKELTAKDSVLLQQSQQKDSTIMAYISSLNEIQDNLNAIKSKEKIILLSQEPSGNTTPGASIVSDIKSLDALIVKNHKEINILERKLSEGNKQDKALRKLIANLSDEVKDKDSQIAAFEEKLAKANDSIKLVVSQFNDSLIVLSRQKMEINAMQTEINTVYYAVGTYKELKDNGVVTKEGTVMGIGGVPELKQNFNVSYFTAATAPNLQAIPLRSKFYKLVTNHPADSYKIASNGKTDTFIITDPASFWSESRYLVILINSGSSSAYKRVKTNVASLFQPSK